MAGSVGFYVQSLSAGRVPDKLAREKIPVLFCREVQKNTLEVRIRAKDMKKAFAILRSSCYHIDGVKYYGLARAKRGAVRAIGLLLGAVLFFTGVTLFESRILKVEVVGSGAYYEREVRTILEEEGVKKMAPMSVDTARATARVLSLPRVEFCTFRRAGGILTVEILCCEDARPIAGTPLKAPAAGVVVSLTVVRGTSLVSVGDTVEKGQTVVGCYILAGEEQIPALAIAAVTVRRTVSAVYPLPKENALAQALIDFGPLSEVHTEKTGQGWRITAFSDCTASVNLA